MNEFILAEINYFLASFLWGAILFCAYDIIIIFRAVIPHIKVMVAIEDIGFWVTAGILIFRMMYQFNDGTIRYYAIIAIFLGMKLYQLLLSKWITKMGCSAGRWVKKQIFALIHLLTTPMRFIITKIKGLLRIIGKFIKKRYMVLFSATSKELQKRKKTITIKLQAKKKKKKSQKSGKDKEPVDEVKQHGVLELITEPRNEGNYDEEKEKKK